MKKIMIEARRIASWVTIETGTSEVVYGNPGDWIITEPDGKQHVMDDDEFHREFIVIQAEVIRKYKSEQSPCCSPDFEKRVLEIIRDVLREAL